jgi:hypothetical protein
MVCGPPQARRPTGAAAMSEPIHNMIEEMQVDCPSCWQQVSLDVDLSGGSQVYTEDCPVCCEPMTVRLEVGADGSYTVDVEAENG